jgi:hypothetical protein
MAILDVKLRYVGIGDYELALSEMCLFDFVVNLKGLLIIALLPLF